MPKALAFVGRFFLNILDWMIALGTTFGVLGVLLVIAVFHSYNKGLPDFSELSRYDPPTVTRLYAADGKLMAEYATEKRIFVPLKAIPKRVIDVFLSAEDKNFYSHTGVDITGIMRAVRNNIVNYGQGKSLVGGSTITQQVVKNFLLTNEKSLERKVKEAILAVRITQAYSKDKILELYLNEIYLGLGSYGVAAAAQNYFGKSLEELTVDEAALLAAQPKAPNLYNPKRNHDAALQRRNWVINRMREDGKLQQTEAQELMKKPIELKSRDVTQVVNAAFFSEEVRRQLAEMYGSSVLYEGGLVVKTTLNPSYQKWADEALQKALIDYDHRHGYRGPLAHIADIAELPMVIKKFEAQILSNQALAMVKQADSKQVKITYADGKESVITAAQWRWTNAKKASDILKAGDVVLVAPAATTADLHQIPEANGALVALDPHTGRVLAMSGGYSYGGTEFNRATQAKRQPGSAFKPFVYAAALENGMQPNTMLLDAPIELNAGAGQPVWRPQNYHDDYLGEITLRMGLEKSRNTMTVRIAQMIGLDKCMEIGKRLGIYTNPAANFSIVLGTSETTLLNLVNAYGMIVNGGKKVTPSLIERIDDRHGKIIFQRDTRKCEGCQMEIGETMPPLLAPPPLPDDREHVIDPRIAYQMTSLLEGVVQRGTGTRAKSIGKTVGGKTGTTNNSFDTWFVGFSPDLVAGVYIGHDKPRTLGAKETGASAALPAFIDFMTAALKDTPNIPFRVPRGIKFVRTDYNTGQLLNVPDAAATGPVINEAFITGGPVFIPGVTPKSVLDALTNLPGDFEPDESPDLPWKEEPSSITIAPDSAPSPEFQPLPPSLHILPNPPIHGGNGLY
ncbi:MAG: penicillin-binding protein 1A [Alphaproteobacteria bacterium]|nr:penicillin-binding protein 1A [Alphaproteobacteria bacterium]